MTTEHDTLRVVGEWLDEGRTALPDHVLEAVLKQLPAKPQRRPWRPARRISSVFAFAGQTIATTTVVVAAIIGIDVLQAPDPISTGGAPSVVASPSPTPAAVPSGPLAPGRYAWSWEDGQVSFAVEDGWSGTADGIAKHPGIQGEFGLGPFLPGTPTEVTHVYDDACGASGRLVPIGPTVDDLVTALENQGGTEVVKTGIPRDRANGVNWPVEGWRVDIRERPGLDRSECRHGAEGPLRIWADAAETSWFALAPGYRGVVYVFDLDGRRLVFAGGLGPEATEQAGMELDDIVWSLDFGPPATSSLPALKLPGNAASPAGEYGWEGGPGSRAGMHKVNEREGREVAELIFRIGPSCLTAGDGQAVVPVRVAGFDGVSVEPFEPPVTFGSADGDETTRAHALAVGDRTLCVFLTWHSTTTANELAAAETILHTIRAEPVGESSVRITFMLDAGWDIG